MASLPSHVSSMVFIMRVPCNDGISCWDRINSNVEKWVIYWLSAKKRGRLEMNVSETQQQVPAKKDPKNTGEQNDKNTSYVLPGQRENSLLSNLLSIAGFHSATEPNNLILKQCNCVTHTNIRRTCKLPSSDQGIKPRNFFLWGISPKHSSAVLPIYCIN